MKSLFKIILLPVILLFSCDKEEQVPTSFTDLRDGQVYKQMVIEGTTWMAEDLRYGTPPYSYQQALSICPEGWSLPSKDDWAILALAYGGYQDYENEVGDASKAHQTLKPGGASGLNINGNYWVSDPLWKDSPYIRSTTFIVHEDETKAKLGGTLINFSFNCRCVKREKEISNGNFIEVSVNGVSERYEFFPTYFPEEFYKLYNIAAEERLGLFLYKQPIENDELSNRISIGMKFPPEDVNSNQPIIAEVSSINVQKDKGNIYKTTSLGDFSEDYEMKITFFDGEKIEGTFSGTSVEDDGENVEGTFMIYLPGD
ncbi:hypothetical protein BH23BAC1_BH23BAC1_46940 [soil metagenome]